MLAMWDGNCLFSDEIAGSDEDTLQNYISVEDDTNRASAAILFDIAKKVAANEGAVPQTLKELKAMNVDDTVAALLMQDVFCSTDVVVGLHGRKIVTALDMFDWEEIAKEKVDIKMAKINPSAVKKSLKTWIPRGEAGDFHGIMESLGVVLARDAKGDWGRVKSCITKHFAPKEKKDLTGWVEAIVQFYKATKRRRSTK